MSSDTPQPTPRRHLPRGIWLNWMLAGAGGILIAYRWPGALQTILAFILVLGVLVFVHEWGHYQFARWAGMKINRFAVGFPPYIYTHRRNDIDYSIGALPIGGMVDIAGLGSEEEMLHQSSDPKATPERHPERPHGRREFQDASAGWRFLTLFAGPLMNFIFAILAFVVIFTVVGVPLVSSINQVEELTPGGPAARAGIQKNDFLIGVNGTRTNDVEKLSRIIRGSGGRPITVQVRRGEPPRELSLRLQPVERMLPKLDGPGEEKAPAIGIAFRFDVNNIRYERVSPWTGLAMGFIHTANFTRQLAGVVVRAFTFRLSREEREGVGGPVKIAEAVGQSARSGPIQLALLAASLSINLGLLNLLPFPALDGGRILFVLYEVIARKPFDARKETLVHTVGMAMVLAFMLFITVRDVLPWIEKGFNKIF